MQAGAPFVLLTNGGGRLESQRAAEIAHALSIPLDASRLILSHTPMRALVPAFAERKVLIIGGRDSVTVARKYGFSKAVDTMSMLRTFPDMHPLSGAQHVPCRHGEDKVEAVVCFHDSVEWGAEIQVCCDVLRGGDPPGTGGLRQQIPLYLANADFLFKGTYPVPRLAGGAFVDALDHLFHRLTGQRLCVEYYGKPFPVTYRYAERQLLRQLPVAAGGLSAAEAAELDDESVSVRARSAFDAIFMVGDNPASDVRGATLAGPPWRSCLVRTGVFGSHGEATDEPENDASDPADHVVPGVYEAVELALGRAKMSR